MKTKKRLRWLLAAYLILLTGLMLVRQETGLTLEDLPALGKVNLIPFAQSLLGYGQEEAKAVLVDVVSFVPVGMFYSLLRGKGHLGKDIWPVLGLGLLYQGAAYLLPDGFSDVTALLANTLGGAGGLGVYYRLVRKYGKKARALLHTLLRVATILLAAGFAGYLVYHFVG